MVSEWFFGSDDEESEETRRVTAHFPGNGKMELREQRDGEVQAWVQGDTMEVRQ